MPSKNSPSYWPSPSSISLPLPWDSPSLYCVNSSGQTTDCGEPCCTCIIESRRNKAGTRLVESSPAPGSGTTFAATQTPHVRACGCPSTPRRMCPRWATCKTPATPNGTFRISHTTPPLTTPRQRQLAERECVPAPSCASTKDTRNSAATDLTASLAVSHRAVILGLVSL